MATFKWDPSPDAQVVTQYDLEKSTDDGETFTALATILNDPTDPLIYDPSDGRFFFVDVTPVTAEIVRIAATNAQGQGPFSYLYAPPDPSVLVNVYGIILDTLSGRPKPDVKVYVVAGDSKKAALIANPGASSLGAEGAVAVRREVTLHTDEFGRWQIDLLADQEVIISIPESGLVTAFRVPDDISVLNFRDTNRYRIPMPDFADVAGGVGIAVSLP